MISQRFSSTLEFDKDHLIGVDPCEGLSGWKWQFCSAFGDGLDRIDSDPGKDPDGLLVWELSWEFFWRFPYLGVTCQRCLQTLETLLRRKREIFTTIIMIIMPRQRHHYQLTRSPLNPSLPLKWKKTEEVMLSLCFSNPSHRVLLSVGVQITIKSIFICSECVYPSVLSTKNCRK